MGMVTEQVTGVLRTLTIFDVLDISIVSVMIYQAFKLVRDTRALQLVKGLLVLFLLFFISQAMQQLRVLSFIMTNIIQIGAMALLIVFQPELRRMLEQVGRTQIKPVSLFTSVDSEANAQQWRIAIGYLVQSCANMSRSRTGALIVLERQTKLGDIIKTGTVIDAAPSSALIENIFFHNSPLHDGSVIMRNGRIHAAGCYLPLSDNYEINREFGTRHRAALGMSENSDAVVVVVSEETGAITLAVNGRLDRGYTPERLSAALIQHLLPEKTEDGEERKMPFARRKK
jgi:diadenylate cyclase